MTTTEIESLEKRVEKLDSTLDSARDAVDKLALQVTELIAHFSHIITDPQVDEKIKAALDSQHTKCALAHSKFDVKQTIKNAIFIATISGAIVTTVLSL